MPLLGLLCHGVCCCGSWASQLGRTVGHLPPLDACMVLPGTMNASPLRDEAFKLVPVQGSLGPVLEEPLEQPWPAIQKKASYVWCWGFCFVGLWLLEESRWSRW